MNRISRNFDNAEKTEGPTKISDEERNDTKRPSRKGGFLPSTLEKSENSEISPDVSIPKPRKSMIQRASEINNRSTPNQRTSFSEQKTPRKSVEFSKKTLNPVIDDTAFKRMSIKEVRSIF